MCVHNIVLDKYNTKSKQTTSLCVFFLLFIRITYTDPNSYPNCIVQMGSFFSDEGCMYRNFY